MDLFVQQDHGIFEKHGLDVTLELVDSSSQLVGAVLSGAVDIGVGAGANAAGAIMQGADLRFVAVGQEFAGQVYWGPKDVHSFEDFRGKTIGVTNPGSLGDQILTALLERSGMTRSDIEVAYLGGAAELIAAMLGGAGVDGAGIGPPQGYSELSDAFHVVLSTSDLPWPSAVYVATAEFVEQKAEVLSRFIASQDEALEFLRTHEAETIEGIIEHTLEGDPDAADLAKVAYDHYVNVWATTSLVPVSLIEQAFSLAVDSDPDMTPPDDVTVYIPEVSRRG